MILTTVNPHIYIQSIWEGIPHEAAAGVCLKPETSYPGPLLPPFPQMLPGGGTVVAYNMCNITTTSTFISSH